MSRKEESEFEDERVGEAVVPLPPGVPREGRPAPSVSECPPDVSRGLSGGRRDGADDSRLTPFFRIRRTIHDLRRSFASGLTNAGAPDRHIAALLGQQTTRIVSRYAHAELETLRAEVEAAAASRARK